MRGGDLRRGCHGVPDDIGAYLSIHLDNPLMEHAAHHWKLREVGNPTKADSCIDRRGSFRSGLVLAFLEQAAARIAPTQSDGADGFPDRPRGPFGY